MKKKELFDVSKLKEFGRDFVKILTIQLKKSGKSASGALINSLDYRIIDNGDINIEILSNDYLEYVDKGRKPGTYPPLKEISKWATLKGIPQGAVFPIARSIYKFGIKPTNVLDKTKNEILKSTKLNNKLGEELVENIEEIIINNFNQ